MRQIVSTEKILIDGVVVSALSRLGSTQRQWVLATRKKLLAESTMPESVAAKTFSRFPDPPTRQAYFLIRGRHYFLDFFFPERMLAIEIDGFSHLARKGHDRKRDSDFRSIGIRTIRVSNKDVMNGNLTERIFKRLYR